MTITLTQNQKDVLDKLLGWYKNKSKNQFITLGGFAGTGKTTLISIFREKLYKLNPKLKVAFCAYTGKAARVLKTKLIENDSIYAKDNVSTIHSLIYSPITNNNHEIIGWEQKQIDEVRYDLIIIDEASMVDLNIWKDLLSYAIPIIAVGDHGQLPPINSGFSLMQRPLLRLEQIHRQAEGNPIIEISILARTRGFIPHKEYSSITKKINRSSDDAQTLIGELLESYDDDTLLLCGYNNTRIKLNRHIREVKNFHSPSPLAGDKVICLRNNHKKNIYNGMTGKLSSIEDGGDDWYYAKIDLEDEETKFEGLIYAPQFNNPESLNFTTNRKAVMQGDLFDFGYAMTVHKAQGSQAKKVILFEEKFRQMDDEMWRRWLYTAVTRAEKELYIVG